MSSNNDTLIVFATGWGAKFGGINSLNADLISTFSMTFKENVKTICFVLFATDEDVNNALKSEVLLLSLTDDSTHKNFNLQHLPSVFDLLDQNKIADSLNERTVWLGHDRITGEIAIAAAQAKNGKSVLIHHMSYAHYEGFNENSMIACKKIEGQENIFQQADIVIGIGPKLAGALADRVKGAREVQILIPGLAEIDPAPMPTTFTMYLSGRLEDKLKQARLGIAGFSHAIRRADHDTLLPEVFKGENEPRIVLRGIDVSDANEQNQESSLKQFAEEFAGRYVNLLPKPFTSDRRALFEDLRTASVALMPSWHEGFGLVAWEAIAAGVPIILSKKSGVFQFLSEFKHGKCLNWIIGVDILGQSDEPFFRVEDKETIANALLEIAKSTSVYREKALLLRDELKDEFSWLACATQFANYIGWNHLTAQLSSNSAYPKGEVDALLSTSITPYKVTGKIKFFRDSYLISDSGPLAFGGRDQEIQFLNSWLQDEGAPNRLLMTAPTGRGKSALLVRWTEELRRTVVGECWQIVFVPISLRFNTNRPSVFYESFASRLVEIDGKPIQNPVGDPEGFYTGIIAQKLGELAETNQKILIVIDGVDEALGQKFDMTIFPVTLPVTMKIIVSARELLGDHGANGWKKRLEWDGGIRVSTIELTTLDRAGIDGVLKSIVIGDFEPSVIDRLMELTAGEPLLVRLYAEDIADKYKSQGTFSVADLINIKPGFAAFFSRWLTQQRQAWKDEGQEIDEPLLEAVLKIFSCALGPIPAEHFSRVLSSLTKELPSISISRLLSPIKRFINGDGSDGSGYVLNHPKFSEFLREEYFDNKTTQEVHLKFVNWGNSILEQANSDKNDQPDIPAYLLQYYPQHLEASQAPVDKYVRLLSKDWWWSWRRFEGGDRGFSSTIQSVLSRIGSTVHYLPDVSGMAKMRIRAALCQSSINSIVSNFPCELLTLALDEELVTLTQALHSIELQPTENQPEFYAAIIKYLGKDQINDAIYQVNRATDIGNRAQFLLRILPSIPTNFRHQTILDIYDLICKIQHPLQRATHFVQLVSQGLPDYLDVAFEEVKKIPLTEENNVTIATLFSQLFSQYEESGKVKKAEDALHQSISVANRITDISKLAELLPELSKHLPNQIIQELLGRCKSILDIDLDDLLKTLEVDSNFYMKEFKVNRVLKIHAGLILLNAKFNSSVNFEAESKNAISLFNKVQFGFDSTDAILSNLFLFVPELQEQIIRNCFSMSCNLPSANNRLHAMIQLAKHASGNLRNEITREALKNTQLIEDEYARGMTLIALFVCLSQEDKKSELMRVYGELCKIPYVLHRGELFIKLASHIGYDADNLRNSGLGLIRMASDSFSRINSLVNNFDHFPDAQKNIIFRECFDGLVTINHDFFPLMLARLAEKAEPLWNASDLEVAYQISLIKKHDWGISCLFAPLASIAIRLNRMDIIDFIFENNQNQNDILDEIRSFKLALPYLRPIRGNECDAYLSRLWCKTLALSSLEEKAKAQVSLVPLFSTNNRHEKWCIAKTSAVQISTDYQLLKDLSDSCVDEAEKEKILKSVFAITDQMFPSPFPPINRAPLVQLQALDRMTEKTKCNRSTLLTEIKSMSPVFESIGGSELVRGVMEEVLENAEWWP